MEEQQSTTTTEKVPLKKVLSDFKDSAEDIVNTYSELAMVTVTKKAADTAAFVVTRLVMVFVVLLALAFTFIAVALWLGELLGSNAAGFGIVAGFFILVFVLSIALKGKVLDPFIRNSIVKKVYETRNKAENNEL